MSELLLFERNHQHVQDIIASLKRECALQREYLRLVEEEKAALQKLKSPSIDDCSTKRDNLIAKLKQEQELRIGILKGILKQITSNRPELRLTTIAERVFHPEDTKLIKEHCGILVELIELGRRRTRELEGIVAFSMKLVTGSISTILSHTQKQIPIYNSYGKVPESGCPTGATRHLMSRTA